VKCGKEGKHSRPVEGKTEIGEEKTGVYRGEGGGKRRRFASLVVGDVSGTRHLYDLSDTSGDDCLCRDK